jgi:hypothetical protein
MEIVNGDMADEHYKRKSNKKAFKTLKEDYDFVHSSEKKAIEFQKTSIRNVFN